METTWLREALFAGMSANAFKLGTVLTLGWFWPRISGCSVLYRGGSMEEIDFGNILAVAEADACEISPPSYVPHGNGLTYYYVVRRANNCGDEERTLAAAVKVSIDSNGDLAEPRPNNIFEVRGRQVNGNEIQLIWYYCPIEQESVPTCFKVYYGAGTGQVDYENAIAVIHYVGRKFYSYQSGSLDVDKYLFCIKAEDAAGTESGSSEQIRIQLDTTSPDTIDIVNAETV